MAFLNISNVKVTGLCASIPSQTIKNREVSYRISENYENSDFVEVTGVEEFRYTSTLTAADLCYEAAEQLIKDLKWNKGEIDAIIVVSQTLDYILPATACILQERLGLSKECFAEDIPLGCSGWIYGVSTLASLMQNGYIKKALLLAGDARWHTSINEQKWNHLFGMAATATALEYEDGAEPILCHLGTDGSGFETIMIPYGGTRNQFSESALKEEEHEGKMYNGLQSRMKGMDVFAFGISTAPKSIKKLSQKFGYDYLNSDFFVFHQANKKMLETIVKKLKLPKDKVPDGMKYYGNTSSASIPLTIVTALREKVIQGNYVFTCCGFGVGLSWGTIRFATDNLTISPIIEVDEINE